MKKFLLLFSFALPLIFLAQTPIISSGDAWKYLDDGSNQGTTWRGVSFNDATWASGASQLGYGDGDEATVVSYGPSSSSKYITTYFRKTLSITTPSQYLNFVLRVKRDDGAVVYVNGTEVYRSNLGTGTVNSTSLATSASDDGATWQSVTLSSSTFVNGSNTIAVEIHQTTASSSDISFDLDLNGYTTVPLTLKDIRWGSSNDPLNGLTVNWSNVGLTDSIKWGYTTSFEQGTFIGIRRNGNSTGNYFTKYTFPTVQASTAIYYKLYDSNVGAWSMQYTFNTAPPVNTSSYCFLGVGDSRSGLSVWNTISTLAYSKNADFTLYNGDIVNNGESNSDWTNWFSNGNQFIQNSLIYHTMGNHDVGSSNKYTNTFELPQVGGSNLYYSFTYGNGLFIALNSEDASDAAQVSWLVNTLQNNTTATWKVVFFHRPFYTIGSHAGEMNAYFNTIWKAFDDYGVDLVINGHDHMYERTKPINRNISTTAPVANYGSGVGEGRCQLVCGGAGAPLYTGTATNFIQEYQSEYNFVKVCVTGNSLHADVYDDNNAVLDSFTLSKPVVVGIQNKKQQFNPIEIYPNPTKNSFTIKNNSAEKGNGVIRIVDLTRKTEANLS